VAESPRLPGRLALWAGPEPTVNRLHATTLDQIEATGFAHRLDDIDRLASLGAERVRFPLLWERTAPHDPPRANWGWADARLPRLAALGIAPIVGLVHHGSGPFHTHLLDPAFADKLARYASLVAQRYPWVQDWTPVNEPVTTARFSGLYGLWYPHHRHDRSFVRALLNQVAAVRLAMRAIRALNPAAKLVQTDDLGHISGTRRLRYQTEFENERRWLSFDLLAGRVTPQHPLWRYLRQHGATERELMAFVEAPCPADIIGINVYITSERFLDHRVERYPADLAGGNGRHEYVDLEAVRVRGRHIGGFAARLREAHARYGGAVAITEAHLGCTREEQMRWLLEGWRAAEQCRAEGIDVRAVTAWAAFGSCDWNSLVTRAAGHYEPGLWDCRSTPPRPTALAQLARELAAGTAPSHPLLAMPGWWRRSERVHFQPHGRVRRRQGAATPLAIIGARGTLARALARLARMRGIPCISLGRDALDAADAAAVAAALDTHRPWGVINAAGFVRVDDAEHDAQQWRDNAVTPSVLARACAERGLRFVTYSSDLVFDGAQTAPYVETDAPHPLNAYGRAKLAAERDVLAACPAALVIRTAAFFGPWDDANFVARGLQALARGEAWHAADDLVVSPTYVPDLVQASLDLLIDGDGGLWHLANRGAVSWADFARAAAQAAGQSAARVVAVPAATLGLVAARPRNAALASARGALLGPLDAALARYIDDTRREAASDSRAAHR
jgi:dTDP-4-dehydrorhamnose reductase